MTEERARLPGEAGSGLLAATIYHWGLREQDRLLATCVGPLVAAARAKGLCDRLWFARSDVRGPHVKLLVSSTGSALPALAHQVSSALLGYLGAAPSAAALTPHELASRHAAWRGKTLTGVDHRPGIADNNTLHLGGHDPTAYPFSLGAELDDPPRLWRLVDRLSVWAIEQLAGRTAVDSMSWTMAPAVRWLAALEEALAGADISPADYWRHHAGTLAPELEERLARGQLTARGAMAAIGRHNRETLARLWHHPASDRIDLRQLIDAAGGRRGFAVLREVVHTLFGQLGGGGSKSAGKSRSCCSRGRAPRSTPLRWRDEVQWNPQPSIPGPGAPSTSTITRASTGCSAS